VKKLDAKIKLGAPQVLATLREKMFAGDAWAWMTEVRNGTGYARSARSADALAVSCWPSRGLFAAGIEIKVSRSDWKHELLQPAKSDEVQRFCRHWWIATSPGIVLPEELPPTWGLVETDGKVCSVVRQAPELQHADPTWLFVASVLRNATKGIEHRANLARCEGREEGLRKAAALIEKSQEQQRELRNLETLKERVRSLEASIDEFRKATGLGIEGWANRETSRIVNASRLLKGVDLEALASGMAHQSLQLQHVSDQLKALVTETGLPDLSGRSPIG
jgi:hypothetical protein